MLPPLPVLLQRRAPIADIRRKINEDPACLSQKDVTVRQNQFYVRALTYPYV